VPDDAHNHTFDMGAAQRFYAAVQRLDVPLTVVSRHAAYAACIPRSFFDRLAAGTSAARIIAAKLGTLPAFCSPIARRFARSQKASMMELFERACADGEGRQGLPLRCDRSWFLLTFCVRSVESGVLHPAHAELRAILALDKLDPQRAERVRRLVTRVNAYDVLAAVATVPSLRQRFFDASCCGPQGRHSVIGRSAREHGVRDPAALQAFMVAAMEAALR